MDLVESVYAVVVALPRSEDFGLAPQMRRAVVSVPANIAEGFGRTTARDYANFLSIAKGSVMETETLLLVAGRLGYVDDAQVSMSLAISGEVGRMLSALRLRVVENPAEAPRVSEVGAEYFAGIQTIVPGSGEPKD